MRTIRNLLNEKGYSIWYTTPESTVFEALKKLEQYDIGALVVLEDSELVGIFSERDYARKVILRGKASRDIPVREIMNHHVITIDIDQTVENALTVMNEKHIRHLPVMEADQLVGVVSIGDLAKAIIAQQEELITKLEGYILANSSLTP
jgi:CBS domain-containing protein